MSKKQVINSENAPQVIGPYAVANRVGDLIFTAGQLGLEPHTGNLVPGGIEAETRQTLVNIQAVLEAAGSSLMDVVKTTVYLKDIGDFAKMNAIYGEFFTTNYPARSTVQVAALPKGGVVEIDAVAVISD